MGQNITNVDIKIFNGIDSLNYKVLEIVKNEITEKVSFYNVSDKLTGGFYIENANLCRTDIEVLFRDLINMFCEEQSDISFSLTAHSTHSSGGGDCFINIDCTDGEATGKVLACDNFLIKCPECGAELDIDGYEFDECNEYDCPECGATIDGEELVSCLDIEKYTFCHEESLEDVCDYLDL